MAGLHFGLLRGLALAGRLREWPAESRHEQANSPHLCELPHISEPGARLSSPLRPALEPAQGSAKVQCVVGISLARATISRWPRDRPWRSIGSRLDLYLFASASVSQEGSTTSHSYAW